MSIQETDKPYKRKSHAAENPTYRERQAAVHGNPAGAEVQHAIQQDP